jgi:hypothetical protein
MKEIHKIIYYTWKKRTVLKVYVRDRKERQERTEICKGEIMKIVNKGKML